MNCQEIQNRLELYIDNELSELEKAEVETHLVLCVGCAGLVTTLKSIDSLGKSEIFLEPSPSYWKESRLNIMNEIKTDRKTLFNPEALLYRLKDYLLPKKLSFRLAGLVATAVIVFFIIHISFIRQGKFELPKKIEIQDSISLSEQPMMKSKEIKDDQAPEAPRHADPPEAPKLTTIQHEVSEQLLDQGSEVPPIIYDEAHEIGKLPESEKLFEHQSNIEAEELAEQHDRKESITNKPTPSQRETRRLTAEPAYIALEKKGGTEQDAFRIQSIGASKSASFPDSSIFRFEMAVRKVLSVREIPEKIEVWENYIQTKPGSKFLRMAKFNQAQLYFILAQKKKKKGQVQQAINFYYNNFDFLVSDSDSTKIIAQFDILQQLLQEIRKK